jgi:hypothetical protein
MRVRTFICTALITLLFPAVASANYPHVVQPGETLTSVAATDGLSVATIAAANGISSQAQLVTGRVLWIPPRPLASNVSTVTQTQSDPDSDDDTDATASEVSTTTHVSTTSQAATTSSSTAETQSTQSGVAPIPTSERASAGEIASIADANGVPASFAEAIAWQESGWNNDEVSGAGAVGIMQIVPATWTWIDRYLTPSAPLGTASAAENIRGGVLLLHQLLGLTGGNESLAAAGYFQGLSSVQSRGMYRATRQYVADVMALTGRL